jgi:putative transposase
MATTPVRQRHPARWSRGTGDWTPITTVTLNPEREVVVAAEVRNQYIQPRAA